MPNITPTHTLVYSADKQQFLSEIDDYDFEELIHERYKAITGSKVSKQEVASWRNSLNEMAKVLRDAEIPANAGVGIELFAPQSLSRIDFVLTGLDAHGNKKAIIVELKQWSSVKLTEKDAVVHTYLGNGLNDALHPSYQAWSYATLFEGFNEAVSSGDISIIPCAYLHNYDSADSAITDGRYQTYISKAPLFLKGSLERKKFRNFIKSFSKVGDSKSVLNTLICSKIGASKALADALGKMLNGKEEFVLINDQKLVFENIRAAAKAAAPGKNKVVIVEGGPGTGKTVVAINLLVKLLKTGIATKYVSKNAAPRHVYKAKLTGFMSRTQYDNLFIGADNFFKASKNTFDLLLVDEAHRLTEKSGIYSNLGENQVKELINAAKCTVFFIDEDQRVTFNDIGSKEQIIRWAKEKGAEIEEYELSSQFRCNGSDGYLAWLDNTLNIKETANKLLNKNEYEFTVFNTPDELHDAIQAKNSNDKARVVAGYCWPWNSKNDTKKIDIEIGPTYKRQWNLSANSSLWIITPNSIDQVGCIHTCQGLEVDYIGVIIGPDLIVRDGEVITVPERRSSMDKSIRGYKTQVKKQPEATKAKADRIIKNTYRTLMSRGMKGCFIYCTDKETADYFRNRLTS